MALPFFQQFPKFRFELLFVAPNLPLEFFRIVERLTRLASIRSLQFSERQGRTPPLYEIINVPCKPAPEVQVARQRLNIHGEDMSETPSLGIQI